MLAGTLFLAQFALGAVAGEDLRQRGVEFGIRCFYPGWVLAGGERLVNLAQRPRTRPASLRYLCDQCWRGAITKA